MNGKANSLIAAIKSWFEPIVEKSSQRPIALADGLASIVAVLLIVLLKAVLPNSIGWLATGIVITLLAAFVWMDWQKRRA
jgi:VIT1/CCC1 family predicted Fe2+/Mn2+ transporter